MRVIASLVAAASLAAAGLAIGPASPASAYPSSGLVLVANPPSDGSTLATRIICVVQAGSQTTASTETTAWRGSIDCSSPVAMSGTAWLAMGVWHFRVASGSDFSCASCTRSFSSGSTSNNVTVAATAFEFGITAPAGYTWNVVDPNLLSTTTHCTGAGTATFSCEDYVSLEWVSVGV